MGKQMSRQHHARWWRSDSPRRPGDPPDCAPPLVDPSMSATRGVLGQGARTGPGCFQTQSQTGTGTAAHFKNEGVPNTISGYSGHIAGKVAGNCVGGTYDKANEDAIEHLKSTAQTAKFGATAIG